MNDLLQLAVEAHGGLERWTQLTNVKASLSVTGNLWQLKAQLARRLRCAMASRNPHAVS
jgi:hypothetical protein